MLNPEIYGTLTEKQARIIKGRSIEELVSFFEIVHAAREIAWAAANAPSHHCADHDMLETLFISHLELLRNTLMDEIKTRKPKSTYELELRNECLCTWAMMCGDFPGAAKVLVDLLSDGRNLPATAE